MSITVRQAEDILSENFGSHLAWDDPEWWDCMTEWAMRYANVRALRREHPDVRVPRWWPGAQGPAL